MTQAPTAPAVTAEADRPSRYPRSVFDEGDEPDVRFTFANERTFLAWSRTALALIAGGVALGALDLDLQDRLRFAASVLLVTAGTLAPIVSWLDWAHAERALRLGRPLPRSPLGLLLGAVVCVAGVIVLLSVLLR